VIEYQQALESVCIFTEGIRLGSPSIRPAGTITCSSSKLIEGTLDPQVLQKGLGSPLAGVKLFISSSPWVHLKRFGVVWRKVPKEDPVAFRHLEQWQLLIAGRLI
jgi:hypothetical protein